MKVLLIEYNSGDTHLMREMLAEARDVPFDLVCADRLSTGLEHLSEGGIDIVLLDLSLPDSQGLDTFARVYAQAPQVPIVVLTGLDDETLAVKAVQEGAQDYLIKGQVEINLLVRAMRYAIERKRAEEALQRSQEQLHQGEKMKALGTLVAGVAHEINNPINLIMFNIPLLKKIWHDFQPVLKEHADREIDSRYGGLPYDFIEENLSQLLSDMEMAASRVAKIVTDLKNFARQSDVAHKKPIQINMAVKNAMRLASTTLRKSGIHLKLSLGNNLPLMEANLQSIEQIVLNLIINAIEAINHDRGRVVVETGFQQKDKRIFI